MLVVKVVADKKNNVVAVRCATFSAIFRALSVHFTTRKHWDSLLDPSDCDTAVPTQRQL